MVTITEHISTKNVIKSTAALRPAAGTGPQLWLGEQKAFRHRKLNIRGRNQ